MSRLPGGALLLVSWLGLLVLEVGEASDGLGVLEDFGAWLDEAALALLLRVVVLNELEEDVGLLPVRQIPFRRARSVVGEEAGGILCALVATRLVGIEKLVVVLIPHGCRSAKYLHQQLLVGLLLRRDLLSIALDVVHALVQFPHVRDLLRVVHLAAAGMGRGREGVLLYDLRILGLAGCRQGRATFGLALAGLDLQLLLLSLS